MSAVECDLDVFAQDVFVQVDFEDWLLCSISSIGYGSGEVFCFGYNGFLRRDLQSHAKMRAAMIKMGMMIAIGRMNSSLEPKPRA